MTAYAGGNDGRVVRDFGRYDENGDPLLPPCPICGKDDLFIGTEGRFGCPHCEVAVVLPVGDTGHPQVPPPQGEGR